MIAGLFRFRTETSCGDHLIAEKIESGDVEEMIKAVVIMEVPELELHYGTDGSVNADKVLCQMTLLEEDAPAEDTLTAPTVWLAVKGQMSFLATACCLSSKDFYSTLSITVTMQGSITVCGGRSWAFWCERRSTIWD